MEQDTRLWLAALATTLNRDLTAAAALHTHGHGHHAAIYDTAALSAIHRMIDALTPAEQKDAA